MLPTIYLSMDRWLLGKVAQHKYSFIQPSIHH